MRATTRCTPNVSRATRAEMMLELSPDDTAANAPASSIPERTSTSRSKPMPSTRSPENSGDSRLKAVASRSMIATSWPIRDRASAKEAPTRPHPITTTRNVGPFRCRAAPNATAMSPQGHRVDPRVDCLIRSVATQFVLTTGAAANGGSCVARQDGRVVFVRYELPGETVRARIIAGKDAYWHAEAVEILDPSPNRIVPLCPIAGPDGPGCCDLAFAEPDAARVLKGQVVLNQLDRIACYRPGRPLGVERIGAGAPTGWRTRVRMKVGFDRRAGYHRYRSSDLVAAPDCGQLPPGMLAGVNDRAFPPEAEVHVVVDDNGQRHVVRAGPW